MTDAVINVGDKLHIMTRRLFDSDLRRHFAGEVLAVDGAVAEVYGFAFVLNLVTQEYRRLPEKRARILSVADAGHIVNKIPREIDIESLTYNREDERIVITDNRGFNLSVNEFGSAR